MLLLVTILLVLVAAMEPPHGRRLAVGVGLFGLCGSVHAVASPNIANAAAKQLSLAGRIMSFLHGPC